MLKMFCARLSCFRSEYLIFIRCSVGWGDMIYIFYTLSAVNPIKWSGRRTYILLVRLQMSFICGSQSFVLLIYPLHVFHRKHCTCFFKAVCLIGPTDNSNCPKYTYIHLFISFKNTQDILNVVRDFRLSLKDDDCLQSCTRVYYKCFL